MAFMALPEQYHIKSKFIMKILLIILTILFAIPGCSVYKEQSAGTTDFTYLNSTDPKLNTKDRLVYYVSLLFTGRISVVNDGDTLKRSDYKEGRLDGKEVIFYSAGKIKEERYYTGGLKTGEHTGWWENGKLRFIYHFKDDMFDGNVKVWNESGMLFNDFNYVKGQEEGLERAWFPNGDVQANYIAKNNRKYGITGVKNCQTITEGYSVK